MGVLCVMARDSEGLRTDGSNEAKDAGFVNCWGMGKRGDPRASNEARSNGCSVDCSEGHRTLVDGGAPEGNHGCSERIPVKYETQAPAAAPVCK